MISVSHDNYCALLSCFSIDYVLQVACIRLNTQLRSDDRSFPLLPSTKPSRKELMFEMERLSFDTLRTLLQNLI